MREPYGALGSIVTAVSRDDPEPGAGLLGTELAGGWGFCLDKRASRFVRGFCLPVSVQHFADLLNVPAVEHTGANEVRNQGCGDRFGHAGSMA